MTLRRPTPAVPVPAHGRRARLTVLFLAAAAVALPLGCRTPDATVPAGPATRATVVAPPGRASAPAGARRDAPADRPVDPAVRQKNLASFDEVWTSVRERHYDPTLGGVDWDAAREKYRPLVARARSVDEARGHLQAMINLLGQSHMAIVPGEAYETMSGEPEDDGPATRAGEGDGPATRPNRRDRDGQPGLRVRVTDLPNRVVLVTEVDPGGGAETAGVRPGWQLVRVGETEVAEMVGRVAEAMEKRGHGKAITYGSFAVEGRLHGPVGETTTATFLDGEGQERTVEIPLQTASGEIARLGDLPPMRVDFEARRVEQDGVELGYISFNAFLDPVRLMPQFQQAFADFARAADPVDGVVIDVRGNVGGLVPMVSGIAGFLVDEPGLTMGTLETRGGDLKLAVNPRAGGYGGPVVVLADACSVSAAELLSGGLQALGRARVIGQPTAGEALPSVIRRLPNGDGFLSVLADYVTSTGQRLEGDGVLPDEVVPYDRASLLAGGDPMLAAAARWVKEQRDRPEVQPATRPATQPAARPGTRSATEPATQPSVEDAVK